MMRSNAMGRAALGALCAGLLATATGCGKSSHGVDDGVHPAATLQGWAGQLDVDVRAQADVSISAPSVDGVVDIVIQLPLKDAAGLVPDGKLATRGVIERFPETQSVLTTAKIALPAVADGPCAAQPISLALTLHRRGDDARFAGGLMAYCGANHFYGVPAKMLRLTGTLEKK